MRRTFLYVAIAVLLAIALAEGSYRAALALFGKDVVAVLPPEEVLDKAWFQPHPHLVYVFKPDSSFIMNAYGHHHFTINRYGFRSTLAYDVQQVAKPPNALRIAVLGGSTAMGVNDDDAIWPYLIGKYVSERAGGKTVEVLNEGIMGYTSLDNLLDLAARVIDFDSDVYVIYLGVNDLLLQAPPGIYRTDNSHFRKTLYESLYASRLRLIPPIVLRLKIVRGVLQVCGVPDSRDLLFNTGTAQFRKGYAVKPEDRPAAELNLRRAAIRNVKSMVGIIRAHRPDALILLSSFYDLEERRFLRDLNAEFRDLASELGIVFVDAAHEIPKKQSIAYDYGHFTTEGDACMGHLFGEAILSNLAAPARQ